MNSMAYKGSDCDPFAFQAPSPTLQTTCAESLQEVSPCVSRLLVKGTVGVQKVLNAILCCRLWLGHSWPVCRPRDFRPQPRA